MDASIDLVNWSPALRLVLLGLAIGALPLAWVWIRHRHAQPQARLRALTLLTLFLTFDLILFGAFTRLTDSGLGCPDWPGCYGSASPIGASDEIREAQTALPHGPVTFSKAWIEMIHRYFAMGVGLLILVMAVASIRLWQAERRTAAAAARSPGLPLLTLAWVLMQGAFGAWTVTLKLYPAIVTLHLLGGVGLLALLAVQAERWRAPVPALAGVMRRGPDAQAVASGAILRWAVPAVMGLVVLQVALGGWVSTNNAVLACPDFPTCHGRWWPEADFRSGFSVLRPLGQTADGQGITMAALVGIHWVHRAFAVAVLAALAALAWKLAQLHRQQPATGLRRWAIGVVVLGGWQLATGISNVVLGWPLLAAVSHTGGAALLVALLASLWTRLRRAESAVVSAAFAGGVGETAGTAPPADGRFVESRA